jgi:tRNA(Ile)-lysidine synthase
MKNSILDKVKETLKKHSMIASGDRILIGLSGGADSACLLTLLNTLSAEYDIGVSAAYIDHGLRPDEIPNEIDFCRQLCSGLGIDFTTRSIEPAAFAKQEGLSKQDASRELRYKALQDIASEKSCNKIALAHNADDLAETVLMHLIRGSGPLGLAGIPPVRKSFIRPLIGISRKEVEAHINKEGTGYMTDSSNMKDDYLRNRIRHFIVPAIKNINKDFIATVSRTTDIIREEERYLEIQVTKTLMKLISRKSDSTIELFLLPMEALDKALLRRVLRRALAETRGLKGLGLVHIEDIIKLIKNGRSGDRIYLPDSIRAIKAYSTLILTSETPARLSEYSLAGPGEVTLTESSQVISVRIFNKVDVDGLGDGKRFVCLDADSVEFPLTIRPRKTGDSFYPLGLGKRKKIQDFFVDEKIPRDRRDIIPLLISKDNIALVVGFRVDDRFKVNDNTIRVLVLEVKPLII